LTGLGAVAEQADGKPLSPAACDERFLAGAGNTTTHCLLK